jgi:nucleoside phosphorylase
MIMDEKAKMPLALRNLAALLPLRRQKAGKTYHLLLTSEVSLTSDLLARISEAGDWKTFRQEMQALALMDRVYVLASALKECVVGDGYWALADLILNEYFPTIFTTNVDSRLEEALREAGVHANDIQVLIVGRDQPSYIVETLNNRVKPITILKLYGSLDESVLLERFPDVLALPQEVENILGRLLAQDMIVVGNLEHDPVIRRLLPTWGRSALYVASANLPSNNEDYTIRILEARHRSPTAFVIAGEYGKFDAFFLSLRSLLQLDQTTVVEVKPTPQYLPGPSRRQERAERQRLLSAPRADVLLVVATPNEARAVLDALPNKPPHFFHNGRLYHDLGLIGNARIALMMQSHIGAGGLGGARFTISDGIQTLHPLAVIMVGIACGLQPDEQQIGDILVSECLVSYEPQRLGTEQFTRETLVHHRGERITAPASILGYFKSGHLLLDFANWPQTPRIFFGLILSGDKLLDNLPAREALLMREPEAIGLEMEGVGLYEVAANAQVEWLLVKAISDWGDGQKAEQKERYQRLAAENAARFTLHILGQGGFAPKGEH